MPVISTHDAVERLANRVTKAGAQALEEVHADLFPGRPMDPAPVAGDLARRIRAGLEAEEVVDLWGVLFPEDRNVRYDEEEEAIRYNEEPIGYAD